MDSDEMVYQRPHNNIARVTISARARCPTCDEPIIVSVNLTVDDGAISVTQVKPL